MIIKAILLAGMLATPAWAQAAPSPIARGIVVAGPTGQAHVLTPAMLAAMPRTKVTVNTEPGHGPPQRSFEGPLLWDILTREKLADAAKFAEEVRQTIIVTGHDGYTAVIAMGEISPEFSNRKIILAETMDGTPLGDGHLRIVVPDDKRAGRGVHDVVRIQMTELPNTKH